MVNWEGESTSLGRRFSGGRYYYVSLSIGEPSKRLPSYRMRNSQSPLIVARPMGTTYAAWKGANNRGCFGCFDSYVTIEQKQSSLIRYPRLYEVAPLRM